MVSWLCSSSASRRGTLPGMSESAPTPIEPPPLSPEELAEIRALHERIPQGDHSGTVTWEEVAAELGLPSAAHRR
jgi:hypothetical protein